MKKILFISHDAYRAGAQLLLLNFLKWLKQHHYDIQFDLLLTGEGELVSEFQKLTRVYKWSNSDNKLGFLGKNIQKIKLKLLYVKLHRNNYDLIYNNTFSNGELLKKLKGIKAPIITHVHELDYWIKKKGFANQMKVKENTNFFLTASVAVSNYLLRNNIASNDNLKVVYVMLDSEHLLNNTAKNSVKEFLNLPKEAVIIAASGREDFRKGKDWFIPIAIQVLSNLKNAAIHFIWIGGTISEEIIFDCTKSGFENNIHFIDDIPNANTYFNEFDVFLMLSREDPFPLVNLEAALWEVPIVCFENSGGTEELIAANCGIKVPYGNLSLYAEAIIKLINRDDLRAQLGNNLKKKVIQEYDIHIVGENIVRTMLKVIDNYDHN